MIKDKECLLPPELCVVEGLSKEIRSNPRNMRQIMKTCTKMPDQKFSEIAEFTDYLL